MLWRLCIYSLLYLAGGLAGWWWGQARGALIGVVLAGLSWFVLDGYRGARVLRWLRLGHTDGAPRMNGMWGEAADRARRGFKARDRLVQESEARLQEFLAAIQASPNGVVLLDEEGRIEWCNGTAAAHFGFDLQRDLLQLIGNLVRDPVFTLHYAAADYSHEIVMLAPSSTASRPVRLAVHLHPYGQGRTLLLSRDVTAVETAETMRRDFVANVSHEIRTPLTVLAGFIETLQTLPLDDNDRARYLGLMAQQSHRMQTLVNDLLTLSRLEGSPPPGAAEWMPVQSLVAQVEQEARALSMLLMASQGKGQQLGFELQADSDIAGSQSELISAMSNLVSNAIRYTPAGGSIDVRWQVLADGRGEFSVKDSGPGIAAEHIARLTERFYRVDRSRSRETGGTGLGLAIVKHVVQRHGAELRIDSAPGAGSTFAIVLPAARLRPVQQTNRTMAGSAAQPATAAQ